MRQLKGLELRFQQDPVNVTTLEVKVKVNGRKLP